MALNRRNSIPCTVPDKGRSIIGLVVCNSWDIEPLDLLNGLLALDCYQPSPEVCLTKLFTFKIVFSLRMKEHVFRGNIVTRNKAFRIEN